MLVSDYITAGLSGLPQAAGLAGQLAAMAVLAQAPTAQLERAFAEHVDLCGYRYDAWLLGLVSYQLEQMRAANQRAASPRGGIYLGAYAWLEDLRPAPARLEPAQLPPGLDAVYAGGAPAACPIRPTAATCTRRRCRTPRTAAILRSGYLANATAANPQSLAVNLSSDRVRTALAMLEGIRNGQSLGALLGYQFERALHDDYGLAEVDEFIYPLRKAFPLVADALAPTATPPGVPIEAIEARNVLDGRKLADHIDSVRQRRLPVRPGHAARRLGRARPPRSVPQPAACSTATTPSPTWRWPRECTRPPRATSSASPARSRLTRTGNFPPEPEVVQTPPSGIGLTHRVALHLVPGLAAPAGATPAARAEPAIDAWLGGDPAAADRRRLHGDLERPGQRRRPRASRVARRPRRPPD